MIELSLIIVNYHTDNEVKRLLKSVPKSKQIETILIDNSTHNRGFGKACNLGASKAVGKYLCFLNPDTVLKPQALSLMLMKLKADSSIGIIGPQLLSENNVPYLSSTKQPTRLSAPVVYSFLNTLFPHNQTSYSYWYTAFSLDKERWVESISGAAMMMRKEVFEVAGGFDERLFLYWEDYDLCKRVREAGYGIFYYPKAKVQHTRGAAANQRRQQAKHYFRQSRHYFFRKHFGWFYATLIDMWLTIWEEWRFIVVLGLAAFLRFERLAELMPIIGDQGRDFLAATQAVATKQLPLLGIPSSVPRFKQGPLSIWIFTFIFSLFGADPVYAGWTAAVIGLLAVGVTYLLVETWYGTLAATLASLILATAPLAVTQSRLAFHTNPIPLMSALFLWRLWLAPRTARDYFFLGLSFSLLFQFELAVIPLMLLLFWDSGWQRANKAWLSTLPSTFLGVGTGLIPQIIYDLTHRFSQLGLFGVWLGYRLLSFFGFDQEHVVSADTLRGVFSRFRDYGERFLAPDYPLLSIFLALIFILGGIRVVGRWKRSSRQERILVGWLGLAIAGFAIHGGPSEAYFPMLFVPVSIFLALSILRLPLLGRTLGIILIGLTALLNIFTLRERDYYVGTKAMLEKGYTPLYGAPLHTQQAVINHLSRLAKGREVRFKAVGPGSEHDSAVDNYRFLWQQQQGTLNAPSPMTVWIFTGNEPHIIPDSTVYSLDGVGYAVTYE